MAKKYLALGFGIMMALSMGGCENSVTQAHLPGGELSLRDACKTGVPAICEAMGPAKSEKLKTGANVATQRFKVFNTLQDKDHVSEIQVNYSWSDTPGRPERPIRKGEKIIWIRPWRIYNNRPAPVIKALACTEENLRAAKIARAEALVTKLTNAGIRWKMNGRGAFQSSTASEINSLGIIARPALFKALSDKSKFAAAHVLLCYTRVGFSSRWTPATFFDSTVNRHEGIANTSYGKKEPNYSPEKIPALKKYWSDTLAEYEAEEKLIELLKSKIYAKNCRLKVSTTDNYFIINNKGKGKGIMIQMVSTIKKPPPIQCNRQHLDSRDIDKHLPHRLIHRHPPPPIDNFRDNVLKRFNSTTTIWICDSFVASRNPGQYLPSSPNGKPSSLLWYRADRHDVVTTEWRGKQVFLWLPGDGSKNQWGLGEENVYAALEETEKTKVKKQDRSIVLRMPQGEVPFGTQFSSLQSSSLVVGYVNNSGSIWRIPRRDRTDDSVRLLYRPTGTDQLPKEHALNPIQTTILVRAGKSYNFGVYFKNRYVWDIGPGAWSVWIEDKNLGLKSKVVDLQYKFTKQSVAICLAITMSKYESRSRRETYYFWLKKIAPTLPFIDWAVTDGNGKEKVDSRTEFDIQKKLAVFKTYLEDPANAEQINKAMEEINRKAGFKPTTQPAEKK